MRIDDAHLVPELDRAGLRKFGLTTGLIVVGLFGLLFPILFGGGFPVWPWAALGLLGILALAVPLALRPIYRLWMRFGSLLSKITTPIVLGIVFMLMFVPIAVILKIARRDPMKRTLHDGKTYRVSSKPIREDSLKYPY